MTGAFGGLKIVVSVHAVERKYGWPARHKETRRSARLYKKLSKKFGPQYVEKPCALKTPFGLVVHPEIYQALKVRTEIVDMEKVQP